MVSASFVYIKPISHSPIGLSTYIPSWVKTNPKRFPRVKLRKAGGVLKTADIVSVFHEETRNADAKAFAALMKHLKEFDGEDHTVIMVQVENEVGVSLGFTHFLGMQLTLQGYW